MIKLAIPVLYSDEFLAVCEKPVGVSSESPGLPDLISAQLGRKTFPVHRLDRGTGGAVILAFSPGVCALVQDLFRKDLVRKEYLAVISGRPSGSSGRYEDYLFHDKKTNKSFVVSRKRVGVRDAVCEWEVLDTACLEGADLSLMRVILHTGRTHQIRVQFGSRGLPLVGDRKYGSRIKADAPSLWSGRISFPHPCRSGASVNTVSGPPSVFPWNLFPSLRR